jgi:hypothetical protein
VRGRRRGRHERHESLGDYGMGLADEASDDLPSRLNGLDQTRILAE